MAWNKIKSIVISWIYLISMLQDWQCNKFWNCNQSERRHTQDISQWTKYPKYYDVNKLKNFVILTFKPKASSNKYKYLYDRSICEWLSIPLQTLNNLSIFTSVLSTSIAVISRVAVNDKTLDFDLCDPCNHRRVGQCDLLGGFTQWPVKAGWAPHTLMKTLDV